MHIPTTTALYFKFQRSTSGNVTQPKQVEIQTQPPLNVLSELTELRCIEPGLSTSL